MIMKRKLDSRTFSQSNQGQPKTASKTSANNSADDADSSDSDVENFSSELEITATENAFIKFFDSFREKFSKEISEKINNIENSKIKEFKDITLTTSKTNCRKAIIEFFYKKDLQKVQDCVRALNAITQKHAHFDEIEISDQFVVAQFRGIHYAKHIWTDRADRYSHYKENSIGHPIFSKAVFAAIGLKYYQQNQNGEELRLLEEAKNLKNLLLKMKEDKDIEVSLQNQSGVSFGSLNYDHKADVMSNLFSSNLEQFVKAMQEGKFGDEIRDKFKAEIPYVATGDVPYHALKYAYGVKPYSQKANDSMRLPNSKSSPQNDFCFKSGLHVGKVFLSLHPLTDFNEENGVVHAIEKANAGKFCLEPSILHEQETSFFAYIPAGRVVKEFIAKYPAFKGEYKESYLYKYGLDEILFYKFKKILSIDEKSKKDLANRLLGDYLCRYQEIKLLYETLIESEKRNKILIFKDGKHKFSLYPIDSKQIPDGKPKLDFKLVKSIHLRSYSSVAESDNASVAVSTFLQNQKNNYFGQENSIEEDLIALNIPEETTDVEGNPPLELSNQINELQVKNKELVATVQSLEKQVKTLEWVIEKNTGVKDFTAKVIKIQAAVRGFFAKKKLLEITMEQGWQVLTHLFKKRKLKEIHELSGYLGEGNLLEINKAIKRFKGEQSATPIITQNLESKSALNPVSGITIGYAHR